MSTENTQESGGIPNDFACQIRGRLPEPVYDDNSSYFTIKMHYGGVLLQKMRNFVYEHGKIAYIDYVHPDWFNRFLLDNTMKMVGNLGQMRYLYKIEKKRLSEASFWIVKDADFMNVVRLLGESRIAEMWCLPVVDVLELPWDEKVGHDISVVDVATGEVLEAVADRGRAEVDEEEYDQNVCHAVEVLDDFPEGGDLYIVDNSYVVEEADSNGASDQDHVDAGSEEIDCAPHADAPPLDENVGDECAVDADAPAWDENVGDENVVDANAPAWDENVGDENAVDANAPAWDENLGDEPIAAEYDNEGTSAPHGNDFEGAPAPHAEHIEESSAPHADTNVEAPTSPELDSPHADAGPDDTFLEQQGMEDFSDPDYEQEEEVTVDDDDHFEDTFFRLSEGFDIGDENLSIIEKAKGETRFLKADYAGSEKFEVSNRDGMRWSVDLLNRECACQKWQLTGIPCAHAMSGMFSRNIGIYEYVDECYSKEAYLRSYSPVIQPMSGPELWPELGKHPLQPPVKKKQTGRPKKLRKRSQIEPPTGIKMARTGMTMTCKRCGGTGHNKRTYSEGDTQPSQSQGKGNRNAPRSQPSQSQGKGNRNAPSSPDTAPTPSQGKTKRKTSTQSERQATKKGRRQKNT